MKKIYFILVSVFLMCLPSSLKALENNNINIINNEYSIKSYDVNIKVNENNVMNITEKIEAYFNVEKHGIFRKIPFRNEINRLDGTKSKNLVRIENIKVNNAYSIAKDFDYLTIRIGDQNKILTGLQNYIIEYSYDLGKDPLINKDELYLNIIGNDWDTSIENITFKITMPKYFDKSKLGFSTGKKESIKNENIIYDVNNNVITGSFDYLNIGEALTVRCELPEDYFTNENRAKTNYLIFIIPTIILLISVLLWYIFGKDKMVVETIEFYPPNNLNSLDIGYIYNGNTSKKNVLSLLIYLANKGYIEIFDEKIDMNSKKVDLGKDSEKRVNSKILSLREKIKKETAINPNSKKIKYYENMLNIYNDIDTPIDYKKYDLDKSIKNKNKKNNFFIKKVKEYDGNNQNEKIFLEGLFDINSDQVDLSTLDNDFYVNIERIIKLEKNKYKNTIFKSNNKFIKILLVCFMTLITLTITIIPTLSFGINAIIGLSFISINGLYLLLVIFLGKLHIVISLIIGLFVIMCGTIPWTSQMLPLLTENKLYLFGSIIGILYMFIIALIYIHMDKRTDYGVDMLGKVKGFRRFLVTVESEKLEELVNENSYYFFDILPYTYVLGISDKWISKFESLIIENPGWYNSNNPFDYNSFDRILDRTSKSVANSKPQSSSSRSSSSGGGYSGGGSGGGGGGSW